MRTRRRELESELEEQLAATATAWPADPTWLMAPELAAPSSLVARTEAARSAQQQAGNRAVSRVLARDPNRTLRKPPTPPPPLRSGREVDLIFDTSPYLKDMVGEKLRKVSLEHEMVVDEESAFDAAWLDYAKRHVNPDTGKQFADDVEARAFAKAKGLRAFQDGDRSKVHIRKERSDLGTQLHEGLHRHASDQWNNDMGGYYNANEGVTEFFTRKMGPEVGVDRDINSFLREYTSATHLAKAAGEDVLAAAYFEGNVDGLKKKIDGKGPGTWKKWLDFLMEYNFKAANALLM
ncbi:MAG: hypothetical protein QOH00_2310 [Gaiellales bacterium]|jgi:hypothetical protein|nr:hypothetical protein [Gaiellales bacterium]